MLNADSPPLPDKERPPQGRSSIFDKFVHRPVHRPALQISCRLRYLWLKGTVSWEHVKPVWQAQLFRGQGGSTLQGVACGKPPHGCVVPHIGEAHRGCRAVDLQQVQTVGRCCDEVELALPAKRVAFLVPAYAQQPTAGTGSALRFSALLHHCGHVWASARGALP